MAGQLDSIVTLQQTLDELGAARARLDGVPDWMQELHQEHSGKKAEIEELATRAEEARHARSAAEAALADAQGQLEHYQSQISQVSTQREYGALLKEIDTVKSQIATFEQQAFESLEIHETAHREQTELESSFGELDQRYQTELEKWEQEKPAVERSIAELEGRVERLREAIPQQYLNLFDRLHERNDGQVLAPVLCVENQRGRGKRFWCCGVCNYHIRPQAVVEIRNQGSILQCDCGKRILFVEDQPDIENGGG